MRPGLKPKKMQGILDNITDVCKKRGEKDNISSILVSERSPDLLLRKGLFRSMESDNPHRNGITKDILIEHSQTVGTDP